MGTLTFRPVLEEFQKPGTTDPPAGATAPVVNAVGASPSITIFLRPLSEDAPPNVGRVNMASFPRNVMLPPFSDRALMLCTSRSAETSPA